MSVKLVLKDGDQELTGVLTAGGNVTLTAPVDGEYTLMRMVPTDSIAIDGFIHIDW